MSERLWGILVDSFGKILLPGLTVTIPLTAISFTQIGRASCRERV